MDKEVRVVEVYIAHHSGPFREANHRFLDWHLRAGRLLYGTGSLRKYGAGIGTDEPYCSDNNDQDYRQHHGVLGDVLAFIITPDVIEHRHDWTPCCRHRDEKV